MSTGGMELKALWGTVNAAHSDFADVADAVAWAQEKGYHEVYLPLGVRHSPEAARSQHGVAQRRSPG